MRWSKFYAIAFPIGGLVAWLQWSIDPLQVLSLVAGAGAIAFLVLRGWWGGGCGGGKRTFQICGEALDFRNAMPTG